MTLLHKFKQVRDRTLELVEPLEADDFCVQNHEDVSPPKWHLAHTTWFFEEFILRKHLASFRPFDEYFNFLFNSYYKQVGDHWSRLNRGWLSRPTTKKVIEFRHAIDEQVMVLLEQTKDPEIHELIELGLNHEQQHQELLLMDIKHILGKNPTHPWYQQKPELRLELAKEPRTYLFPEGLYEIGANKGFAYDNERPSHKVFLRPFELFPSLVTNGEYLDFINDKGYENSCFWLSEGWDLVGKGVKNPLYWYKWEGEWWEYTMYGPQKLDLNQPVCHVSFHEAYAFSRYKGVRLPTEHEWEVAASMSSGSHFQEDSFFHPISKDNGLLGTLWQWTESPYSPYPGFNQLPGALGEYNGKFMINQMVLRGGCLATPKDHFRNTYRNYYYPEQRWCFSGIRLARSL